MKNNSWEKRERPHLVWDEHMDPQWLVTGAVLPGAAGGHHLALPCGVWALPWRHAAASFLRVRAVCAKVELAKLCKPPSNNPTTAPSDQMHIAANESC